MNPLVRELDALLADVVADIGGCEVKEAALIEYCDIDVAIFELSMDCQKSLAVPLCNTQPSLTPLPERPVAVIRQHRMRVRNR